MKNALLLLAVFISFSSFSQDKFNGLSGRLKITEDNIWILSWENEDNLKKELAYLTFSNKTDASIFVNDYKDCLQSKKTIKKSANSIISTKKTVTLFNSKNQSTLSKIKYMKNGLLVMQESLKHME